MATTVFFRDTTPGTRTRSPKPPRSSKVGGTLLKGMSTSRGASAKSVVTDTVAGGTAGLETTVDTTNDQIVCWISEPVDQAFTLSGTITLNLRSAENSMSANVAINAVIEKVAAGTLARTNVATTARVTELGTSEAAANFTVTPTSTAFAKGDRIMVWVYGDDAGTMGAGFTFTFWYDGPTSAASGDSFITFTETFGFITSVPAGTTLYPTDDASAVELADAASTKELKLSLARGGAAVHQDQKWHDKYTDFTNPQIYEIEPLYAHTDYREEVANMAGATNGQLMNATTKQCAQSFTASQDFYCYMVAFNNNFTGVSVSATNILELCADNGDKPGTVLASSDTFSNGTLVSGRVEIPLNTVVLLTSGTKYWIKLRPTSVAGATVFLQVVGTTTDSQSGGSYKETTDGGTNWSAVTVLDMGLEVYDGRVISWFSEPLAAFTLSGLATVNLRALETNAVDGFGVGAELAVVNGDGSSATVYGMGAYIDTSYGEVGTSEGAANFAIAGADISVSSGQRLRLRIFGCGSNDLNPGTVGSALWSVPAQTTLPSTGELQLYYAGTSGGASGDAFITLTQSVTEIGASPPFSHVMRTRDRYGAQAR
jgi:hypothetical protein